MKNVIVQISAHEAGEKANEVIKIRTVVFQVTFLVLKCAQSNHMKYHIYVLYMQPTQMSDLSQVKDLNR